MTRRHPPEVRLSAIVELDAGVKVPVVCRHYGITERTLYRWRREATRSGQDSERAAPPPSGRSAAKRR